MFLRSPFGYDVDAASDESGLECRDESRALQSGKEEADINTLVKRFGITGELPQNVRAPLTSDFVAALDFKDAMNAIRSAEESFMAMPAEVRSRFHNDPNDFVNFLSDPANVAEGRKLGLVMPEPVPEVDAPMRVVVVPGEAPVAPVTGS